MTELTVGEPVRERGTLRELIGTVVEINASDSKVLVRWKGMGTIWEKKHHLTTLTPLEKLALEAK